MPLLGIPLWAWLTGGAVVGGAVLVDQTGDTIEQAGEAAEKSTALVRWVVIALALVLAYRAATSAGVLR